MTKSYSFKEIFNCTFSIEEEDIVIDVERNYDEVADYQLVWDSIFDVDEAKSRNPREIEVIVLKNRNGRTGGKIGYVYYAMFNYFEELNETPTNPKRKKPDKPVKRDEML